MRIDPHVHCRDENQSYKTWEFDGRVWQATIAGTLEFAHHQGIDKLADMPNLPGPVTTEKRVCDRLKLVPAGEEASYFLYVGLTANPAQIRHAVCCHKQYPQVIGLKLFTGHSVGPLSVSSYADQKIVFQILAEEDYQGVLAVHCEKDEYIYPGQWKPNFPFSHCIARSPLAEDVSVEEIIEIAESCKFAGTLHICHVTLASSFGRVLLARQREIIRVSCGFTPHHLIWSNDKLCEKDGLFYKTNPPLRSSADVQALRNALKSDWDWICLETDHAPHTEAEKLNPPHLSGYPSLILYRKLIEEHLPSWGVSTERIQQLTGDNIIKNFPKFAA